MGPSWVFHGPGSTWFQAAAATSSRDPGMASGSMTARQIRSHLGQTTWNNLDQQKNPGWPALFHTNHEIRILKFLCFCFLGFVFCWWFFTDSTMVNHHQTTVCENILDSFQASNMQIQVFFLEMFFLRRVKQDIQDPWHWYIPVRVTSGIVDEINHITQKEESSLRFKTCKSCVRCFFDFTA